MARTLIYNRPWLADYQLDAVFCAERYGVTEATTKSGKTVAAMVWLTEQAMKGKSGQNYWWVSPTYQQAKMVYRRLKDALLREVYDPKETELFLKLANNAVIWFKGADKTDSLYGEDVYAAVIDEASRCKADAFHAVRSTLTATNGPIRIIGNVRGRKNWAYHLARQAQGGAPGMHYAKITAQDAVAAGIITAEEVEDAKGKLPADVFRELYMADATVDGSNPFGLEAIRACIAGTLAEPVRGERYIMGVDLAKSVDWSVCVVLDKLGNVVAFERWQSPWDVTMKRIQSLASKYNNAEILCDQTGVGDPIVEQLQRMEYLAA